MSDEQAIEGNFPEIIEKLIASGVKSVYIDGGELISAALQFKLLDQLTVSVVPSLLGKGVPLFKNLQDPINLETVEVQCFDSGLVQMTYEPRPLKSQSQSKRWKNPIVWDKSGAIRYLKPGKGKVHTDFFISQNQIDEIKAQTLENYKFEPKFINQIYDEAGDVVAEVEET